MSEEDVDDLMGEAMVVYLTPLFETLRGNFERLSNQGKADKAAKDEGDDPFIRGNREGLKIKTERNTNVMADAVNVVKFLDENGGFRQVEMTVDDMGNMAKPAEGKVLRKIGSFISKANIDIWEGEEEKEEAETIYKAFVEAVAG